MYPFGSIDTFPVGINPPPPKKNIMKVSGGDTIIFRDFVTMMDGKPVTPDNSILSFCVRDQKFSDEPIWVGGWYDGITLVDHRPGYVVIKVPDSISFSMRRGSYVRSLLVADKLFNNRKTCMAGSILVEYEATSPQLSIPYKDGTKNSGSTTQRVVSDPKYVTGINVDNKNYLPGSDGVVYLPEGGAGMSGACVMPLGDKRYKLYLKIVDGVVTSYWKETADGLNEASATLDGVSYRLRLAEVDGVITSYWERVGDQ